MNAMLKAAVTVFLLSGLTSIKLFAQRETMFSQYMFNESFINPAYTGSHENVSASVFYRNQWVGIEGAPVTQSFNVHAPIQRKRMGLGLSLLNEEIGVSKTLTCYGGFSYRILYRNSALSFGLNAGFINQEEKFTDVKTVVPGDKHFNADINKMFLPNAGFGIYYFNSDFYAGFSIPKLIENRLSPNVPGQVENNIGNISAWHYYLTSGYLLRMNEYFLMKPSLMFKATNHAPMQLDLNLHFLINDFLWFGTGYRTGDAVNALIGLEINKQFRITYSYDYSISKLTNYNSGSHEIGLRYQLVGTKNYISSPRYF